MNTSPRPAGGRGGLGFLCTCLLVGLLGFWFTPGQRLGWIDVAWMDRLQVGRLQFLGSASPHPDILLIGVDEATIEYLNKPLIFWVEDFARLGEALLEGGARAVAFDFFFPSAGDGLGPELNAEFERQRNALLGLLTSGKVAIGYLPDSQDSPGGHSHVDLEQAAQTFDSLVSIGLVADPDGVTRRLYPVIGAGTPGARPSLAAWLLWQSGREFDWKALPLVLEGKSLPLEAATEPALRIAYRVVERPIVPASLLLQKVDRGEPLPEARGKLCVIAPTAISLGDFRTSPLDLKAIKRNRGGTLGVEQHLAAFETMANATFLVPYAPALGVLNSLALGGLLLAAGYRLGGRQAARVGLSTLMAHCLIQVGAFAISMVWLPFWGPLLGGLVGFAYGYQRRYLTVERQKRLTLQMFSRMVAPQVVEKVLSDPAAQVLGGVHRRVTVLYTDINGFTPICERHTPAEVIVMLNQYFEAMVGIVFEHEGMLKQFVGDEIMVIYGAPMDQPDHAARAIATALSMIDCLARMKQEAAGEDGFFEVKVGVNTGDVVVGHVGSEKHMEYAAVGDDVNLGARIMATASKLGVTMLVSETSKREAEPYLPEVEWISHGVQKFKGKTAEVEVFEPRRRKS